MQKQKHQFGKNGSVLNQIRHGVPSIQICLAKFSFMNDVKGKRRSLIIENAIREEHSIPDFIENQFIQTAMNLDRIRLLQFVM